MPLATRIIADTHTHTLASTHAYSTILENAEFASRMEISYLAMTDHAPDMTDAPHQWHFFNLHSIPDELYGVTILKGAEADILADGTLDFTEELLCTFQWLVASVHRPVYGKPRSAEDMTQAYIKAASNPHVDVIGHSDLAEYPYQYDYAVRAFAEYGKLVELNAQTFAWRSDGLSNCKEIIKACHKYEARVVVNSDAHFAYQIGRVEPALALLSEMGFPEELIVNTDVQRFEAYLSERKARIAGRTNIFETGNTQ